MSPQRIQRRRTKGWRMPGNAKYVGRPGKWGNPYWHVEQLHGLDRSLALYADTARGIWDPTLVGDWSDIYIRQVYDLHMTWLKRIGGHPVEIARSELAGWDLACWCSLDRRCHIPTLLEIANGGQP